MSHVYLDWNATAPLRREARDAMISAMDVVGNPSSVHAEGRKAKAIVETARQKVAALLACDANDLVFTGSATEATALVMRGINDVVYSPGDHDCIVENLPQGGKNLEMQMDLNGQVATDPHFAAKLAGSNAGLLTWTPANGETGILQSSAPASEQFDSIPVLEDTVQSFGKSAHTVWNSQPDFAICSAHKLGGPKGVGGLYVKSGRELPGALKGGGQEQGRRSGTENVIGIAGFGAAATAAQRDLDNGLWDSVESLRNSLESRLADEARDAIFIGRQAKRLPNTSCIAVPGWKGETQVIQMDLAGYSISAGSACSSGKVKQSRVLKAMGFDDITASCAIRVSFGPDTTREEVMGFADTWLAHYKKFKARAA